MANKPREKTAIDSSLADYSASNVLDVFTKRDAETAEVTNDLLRALRRKKGFGLFFVQCSPAQGKRVMTAIRQRFPEKKMENIDLSEESETLYTELLERYKDEGFDIACVAGIERALYKYEDTKRLSGWSWEEVYSYSWKGVPPLLSHLNRQREAFEANLPLALVFFVPSFVIDYFVQRSPDFFDWRSGFFTFPESSEELKKASQELIDRDYKEYSSLTPDQRTKKILEIKGKVVQLQQSDCEHASNLLREQGRLFESGGEYVNALDCYNRAIAFFPDNYKVLNSKGSLFYNRERYIEAVAQYEAAIEIKHDYYQAWDNKGDAFKALSQYDEAISSYDRALEIKPDYHYAWKSRGDVLSELERYAEALESYDRALEIDYKQPHYWSLRGDVLYELKRYRESLRSYNKALDIDSENKHLWLFRGWVLGDLKRYEEALESHNRALAIDPKYVYAWNRRGSTLANLERYEEALESYDQALAIDPKYVYAWNRRGSTLANLKRYEEALESHNRALAIDPKYVYSWNRRGSTLANLERYEEALESYDQALAIDPKYVYAWDSRGDTLANLERYEEALESYDQALAIDPKYVYSWNRRGSILDDLERYEEALKSYDQALAIDSEDIYAWRGKGIVFYKLSKFSEAYSCFEKVGRIDPDDEESFNNQGYLLLIEYSYGELPVFGKPLLIRRNQYTGAASESNLVSPTRCRKSLDFLSRAVTLNPNFALAWANQIFPAYYMHDYEFALYSCDKVLDLDPGNEQKMHEVIYTNRGYTYLKTGDFLKSLQSFSTALSIDPELAEALDGKRYRFMRSKSLF